MASGFAAKATGETVEHSTAQAGGAAAPAALWLLCRANSHHFALPIPGVIETLRATAIETIAGAPSFMRGLAIIRGIPVPVIDTAMLFGESATRHERIVTVAVGKRTLGFAAEAVLGIRAITPHALEQLPPLFGEIEAISAIARLDDELVFFLHAARAIPQDVLATIDGMQA